MKPAVEEHRYFYVDETGDPAFYGKGKKWIVGQEGCSRTFGVGFLRTTNPSPLRDHLNELRHALASDRYLKNVPSMRKTRIAFHAKDDCPEVRQQVYRALDQFPFAVQIVIARKLKSTFESKHRGSTDAFYHDLTSKLFESQLHLANQNTILFARRGNKPNQQALRQAVESGVAAFRTKWSGYDSTSVNVETAYAAEEPLLQAADYALWAVQRLFERRESRYFDFIESKVEIVWDIYDQKIFSRRNNPLKLEKVSPLS